MGYADVVLQDGPIGYWPLLSTGANPDGTHNGHVMTGAGGLTVATARPAPNGLTLNGTTGFLSTPHVAAWNTIVSGEAWIKTTMAAIGSIIDHDSWGASSVRGFQFRVLAAGQLSAFSVTSAGTFGTNAQSTTLINDGKVHHVAFTYDGTLRLYVDGVQNGTTDTTAGMFGNPENTPLQIGVSDAGSRQQWFNGYIADAAVYSTALSAATILRHYRGGLRGWVVT
jgi:hypothetical protein